MEPKASIENEAPFHPMSKAALVLMACATAFWTVYPQLTQLNLDPFRDMVENHAWGIRWQWGNSKHPPLFGWLTAAWFELWPRTELSYRALAALNIGVTLFVMLLIARRFLTPYQQSVAMLVALVVPPLGFQAFTYNANSAMLPFWSATVLFYLRVIERGRWLDAVALGLCAAAAMLSKYFAAVLLLALVLHALSFRQTRAIVFSPLTLVVVAAFAALIGPHLVWLISNAFSPIVFAARGQGDSSAMAQAFRQVEFLVTQLAYAAPGLAVMGLLRRRGDGLVLFDWKQVRAILSPLRGQVLVWAGIATVPLTMALALIAQSPLTSNWSLPIFTLVPILLVLILPAQIARRMWHWAFGLALLFMAVMLALSPLIRSEILARAHVNSAVPIAAMVTEAEAVWQAELGAPVAFVGGDDYPAFAATFYMAARPQSLDGPDVARQPWLDRRAVTDQGVLIMCVDPACIGPWQGAGGWSVMQLGAVDVPAVAGAGGPEAYRLHIWRGVWVDQLVGS